MLRRVLNGALLATVALLAACGGGEGQRGTAVATRAHAAVLRAGDMPRGYREGDDTACGTASATEGNYRALDILFRKEQPKACIIELERVWQAGTGPPSVTSAAYVFRDADAARRGFGIERELVEYTASLGQRKTRELDLGDEALLVSGRGLNHPATAIVWRTGTTVAVLAVEPADEEAARAFAEKQEKRLEGEPATTASVDPVELELDDPALRLPVYWLGREFDPPGPLPPLALQEAVVLATGPGDTVKLDYGGESGGRTIGLTLDLWEPARWARVRRTLLGRLVWDSPCAKKTVVRLPQGRAEIYEGYGAPKPVEEPCPARAPDRVIAHVYLPRVVAAVDMPYCYGCAGAPPTRSPYETVAGMTAVARGLTLRR